MVEIRCPLCCNETFPTQLSLKTHLLEVSDSLKCPFCYRKFKELRRLASHLGKDCIGISELDPLAKMLPSKSNVNFEGIFIEETVDDSDSVLPSALSTNEEDDADSSTIKNEEDQDQAGTYFCQMCSVYFENIEEHLQEFHEGQEVTVEEEGELETPTTSEQQEKKIKEEQVPEEQFKDKEGRLYTRKFVKIEKFWLENDSLNEPITQKYIVVNGEVKKISEDEEERLEDKSQVILIHQCPDCDLLFPELDNYKRHKCEQNGEKNSRFKCSHCDTYFDHFETFRNHLKTHSGKTKAKPANIVGAFGTLKCDTCNTSFPTFKSLRLHKRMHDPVKTRDAEAPVSYPGNREDSDDPKLKQLFVCKICDKTYHKQYEEAHMESHDSANDGHNCAVCNKRFFTEVNLAMHMKAHTNNKKFACSYCKKPFMTFAALNEHLTNQCQKRQYACQFCGRRFSRPHEKVKHERIHTGEKPHVCEICNKAFRVSYCLTLHMRTHSGSRPYQCTHCGKRFKSHSAYNHHTQTHSDVRAYKCPYCPKAFKTSVQLAGHKNSHTKPFSCTECNRPFASLYAVRGHMETHKRDNNLRYECWMCGALYSRAFALRDHLKQQHQQTDVDKIRTVAKGASVVTDNAEQGEEDDDDDDEEEDDDDGDATNSILVKDDADNVILEFDGTGANVEVINNEDE